MASTAASTALAETDEKPGEDEDVGNVGVFMPDGQAASATLVGEELLSRVFARGPAATDFVLETMRNDPRPEVQAKGCTGIAQLAERPDGRKLLHDKQGVEVVVEAMMSAMDEEVELQASGCSALANLVIGEVSEHEAAVLGKGGLKAVLAAAKAHPADGSVQTKACLALGNMAFGSAGEAAVLAAGGLDAIVAAMKAHPTNEKLQEEGLDALVNIADSDGGKKQLLAMGGLAVVAAAKKHPTCAETAGDFAAKLVAAAKEGS